MILSRKAQIPGGNGRQRLSVLTDVPVTICGKTVVGPGGRGVSAGLSE